MYAGRTEDFGGPRGENPWCRRKRLVRMAGLLAEIWTRGLPHEKQEY
jgi:hypothetical protein